MLFFSIDCLILTIYSMLLVCLGNNEKAELIWINVPPNNTNRSCSTMETQHTVFVLKLMPVKVWSTAIIESAVFSQLLYYVTLCGLLLHG